MNDKGKLSVIEKLKSKLRNGKVIQFLIVGLSVFIAFLLIIYASKSNSKNVSNDSDVSEYVLGLENRLSETLSKVEGAGKVSVVITVNTGKETVLAVKKNTKETSSGVEIEETPIIVNGKTVTIKEKYPDIVGVLIVAEGVDRISVMRKIQDATTSLLGVELNQIEILAMNK